MKKLVVLLTGLVSILSAGCVVETTDPTSPFVYSSVTRWVDGLPLYVYDSYGVQQLANCSGYVTFYGQVDTRCSALSYSERELAPLDCAYYAWDGVVESQRVDWDFPAGYVHEGCSGGLIVIASTDNSGDSSTGQISSELVEDNGIQPIFSGLYPRAVLNTPLQTTKKLKEINTTVKDFLMSHPTPGKVSLKPENK